MVDVWTILWLCMVFMKRFEFEFRYGSILWKRFCGMFDYVWCLWRDLNFNLDMDQYYEKDFVAWCSVMDSLWPIFWLSMVFYIVELYKWLYLNMDLLKMLSVSRI